MHDRNFMGRSPAEGYRLGIVNPLTLIGRELSEVLAQRSFPYAGIELIDTGGEAAGTLTELDAGASVVTPATQHSFADLDLVFFCGTAEKNEPWIARYREEPFVAIDLAQPNALVGDGLPVVAGVNADRIGDDTGLILSPHPIAVPLVLLIDRLRREFLIELAAASVIRPASEFDQKGIDELFQQTIQVLNLESYPTDVFDRQTAFTAYPPADAPMIERYASAQVRSILGSGIPFSLQLTQGPLFHSHVISLFVVLKEPAGEREVLSALARSEGVFVPAQDETYTSVDAAGQDELLVGRVSRDEGNPRGLWIWAAADNLRRSAALNAVMIAESLVSRFGPKPN
ncbi:MAG TPA: Asd/ArgC dimerization domain-containing protein [Thermoanaerobaculia bacterium]|nr:Asd/ArgC dimerization domain-containing protein [Thermoanaerobaculia bacterium]